MGKRKDNPVENADLLREIHLSKLTFCDVFDNDCQDYDLILEEKGMMFDDENIEKARENRAKRLDCPIGKVRFYDLVFRIMTYEHIPVRKTPKKVIKSLADKHVYLNFKPFKHYVIENTHKREIREVLRSHSNKLTYSKTHGRLTEKLGEMYYLMVESYATLPNWSGYTYIEEMKNDAIVQLITMGLKFDESSGANPHSYMTTTMYRSFLNTLAREKKIASAKETMLQSYMNYDITFNQQAQADIDRYENRMAGDGEDFTDDDEV